MSDVKAYATPAARRDLEPFVYAAGPLRDGEVEIAVERCAICHSDLHLIDDDWGISRYPLVPGHEIVGRVVALGAAVPKTSLAVGDLVGVGWQCAACMSCVHCLADQHHLCVTGKRRTCVDQPGGLAERVRAEAPFVFPIPREIDPTHAAPLLCAGVTVFSPLERLITRPRMRVGVVGLGGLGHLAVQIAAAMGSEVIAFDPVESKRAEAKRLGASDLVGTDELARLGNGTIDLLLTTTHADLDWNRWLAMLRTGGALCLAGVPKRPLTIDADHLLDGQKIVTGSIIGSPAVMRRMLAFAARKQIVPMVETMQMARANEAIAKVRAGQARYRVVLEA